jgi:phospholipid/cholesterol/gamma-HCH transport system substrate-binding protein
VSRSLTTLQAVVLGLLLLLGVGLIGVTVYAVGSRRWFWNDSFHVRAGFPSVQGVEVGTKVRVRGMDAGEVASVEPPASVEGAVELRLRVRGNFRKLIREDATVQIVSVGMLGGKAVEIHPGTESAPEVKDDARLATRPTTELTDVVEQVGATLAEVAGGKGTIGRLAKDPRAYEELVNALESVQMAAGSVQGGAEGVRGAGSKIPFVGGSFVDPRDLLYRPRHERNRKVFREAELFAPGTATLTRQGRAALDGLGGWVEGLKHDDSDVVIAAYADPAAADADAARRLTREQSTAVLEYLKDRHSVHKLGWWSKRKATAVGMGTSPPPGPEREQLPAPRVEVLVFVPH